MSDEQSIRDEIAEAMIGVQSADGREWFIFGDTEDDRADTLVLADAIMPLVHRLQSERDKVSAERLEENRASWIGDAMELVAKAEAERDRLRKAITEMHEWWYSDEGPRVKYWEYRQIRAIFDAALDKEGN